MESNSGSPMTTKILIFICKLIAFPFLLIIASGCAGLALVLIIGMKLFGKPFNGEPLTIGRSDVHKYVDE